MKKFKKWMSDRRDRKLRWKVLKLLHGFPVKQLQQYADWVNDGSIPGQEG